MTPKANKPKRTKQGQLVRLMVGTEIQKSASFAGKTSFCDFSMYVKKGHYECGDSAFVYSDGELFIAAVFDGVSGEPGAAMSSSDAATAVLDSMKAMKNTNAPTKSEIETALKKAFTQAHLAIRIGTTTATILVLQKNGSFVLASIGDSPAYGMNEKGEFGLELPLARVVSDNDSILKFFHFRHIVTSVLGAVGDINIQMKAGKMKKGEMILLASDGVSDNLYITVNDGYIVDSSGSSDLFKLILDRKPTYDPTVDSAVITKTITAEIEERTSHGQRTETKNSILVPKNDDISLIVVKFL